MTLAAAYESCARMARDHYENFPVASLLLPRGTRPHIAAVYAFARVADDLADEGDVAPEVRRSRLAAWGRRLHLAVDQSGSQPGPAPGEPGNSVEIFTALAATIRAFDIPVALFDDLLSAFNQDTVVARYESWPELLDYCRRSANPVGRLVLRVAGYRDEQIGQWSDAVCTALQLVNFWQDTGADFARGRIYLPREVMGAHGVSETSLGEGSAPPELRRALADVGARTQALFGLGRPVCDAVRGRLRYELRATWLGGTRILDRLARVGYDPLSCRPTLGAADVPWFLWRLATWRR